MNLEAMFADDPEAQEALEQGLRVLANIERADPFLLGHLAINQAAVFASELENLETSEGRVRYIASKLVFSVTALAKRVLIDHPQKRIVMPHEVN